MRDYKRSDLYPHSKKLSSSQFLDYIENPEEFYIRWVLGIEKLKSAAMEAGLAFSELFADPQFDLRACLKGKGVSGRVMDQLIEARKFLPVLPAHCCEYELVAEYMGWEFRATLDGFPPIRGKKAKKRIIENKTSGFDWTQETCDNSIQITFQCWCHWVQFGSIPEVDVYVVSTKSNPSKLISHFVTTRSEKQLREFQGLVDLAIINLEAENFTYALTA